MPRLTPLQTPLPADQIRSFSSYPDHEVVGLPALSPTMEAGTIAEWKLAAGDSFDAGSIFCEVGCKSGGRASSTLELTTRHATPPRPTVLNAGSPQVETDKATMDFESQDEGVIAKILVEAGSEVKVGDPIMVTRVNGAV